MIVLDASMVGPLVLPDEHAGIAPETAATLFDAPVVVPSHWRLEVANMLRSAVRRGRISIDARAEIFTALAGLAVQVDRETWAAAWSRTIALSDRHDLTPYDAAYIELAIRRGGTLATLDRAMIAAAAREGLDVLGLPQ